MKLITILFLFIIFFVSPCFALSTFIDVVCPVGVPDADGRVLITYRVTIAPAVGYMISNIASIPIFYDINNREINFSCRCGSLGTRIYFNTLTTAIISTGTWIKNEADVGSVEVVSFAVGGLMGLAFAVASVYKW